MKRSHARASRVLHIGNACIICRDEHRSTYIYALYATVHN